jgi:hypothetical protein
VRGIFPLTILGSLAIHFAIFGGAVLSGLHLPQRDVAPAPEPTLTFIAPPLPLPPPAPVRAVPLPTPSHPAPFHLVAMIAPPKLPVAIPSTAPAPVTLAAPPPDEGLPALAKALPSTEPNPNAHLPTVPPEAALSPVPPPHVDSSRGVVFLLDISGSMYEPYAASTRLTYAREALSRRVRALPDGTPFAIVLYAQSAYPSGPLVPANNATREAAVRFLARDVDLGGGTNLPAGFLAAHVLRTGALVLATDGDLNIAPASLILRTQEILDRTKQGPRLEVIGVAPRAGTDAQRELQMLAELQCGQCEIEGEAQATVER